MAGPRGNRGSKRVRKPSGRAKEANPATTESNPRNEASLSPEQPPAAPAIRAQIEAARLERDQALRDRDELTRIQQEIAELRDTQPSIPPLLPPIPPSIQHPIPQAVYQQHPPLLYGPSHPQPPSPLPPPAPYANFALPQQRTSTPTENENIERRSFLHQGNDPMLASLLYRFQAVDVKYIKQIYHGTFEVKNLNKLSNSFVSRLVASDEETKGIRELIRCFEIYGQIVLFFTHPTVYAPLQEALSWYRCHISDLTVTYTFASVRHFHDVFMYARIQLCQDDPVAWRTPDKDLENQLLKQRPAQTQPGAYQSYNTRPNPALLNPSRGVVSTIIPSNPQNPQVYYCNRFNRGTPCDSRSCRYQHLCSVCGQSHPSITCPTGSSANIVPLGTRPPPSAQPRP